MTNKHHMIIVSTAILLIAVLLRLYHITQQSFWFDEAFAWHIIIQPDMFPRIAADTHPPLFYLFLRGWMTVMGDSELVLRSLSAFISLITVAVMYPLGREIALRLRVGHGFIPLTAMLFFALNDADIFHAQEARNYALYNLLTATSMWFYLRWMRTQRRPVWLLWSASIALLVYTHYQGVFIPAIQALHAILFLRGKTRLWAIGALALAGVALAPWMVLVTLPQAQNALEKGLPFAISSNIETLLDLRHRFLGDMWVLVVGLVLLAMVMLWGRYKKWGLGGLLLTWIVVPFVVLFIGNLVAPLLTDRKLLLITPALCLLMAVGVHHLERLGRVLVIGALLIYSLATVDFYHQREAWREITATPLAYAMPNDLFLAEAEVGQYPLKYYFSRHMPQGAEFHSFTFLGDPTMSPTLDWYTYYDLFLPDVLSRHMAGTNDIATAWVVFWSNDTAVLDRLSNAGYIRTWTHRTPHLDSHIITYRYDVIHTAPVDTFANGMVLRASQFDEAMLRLDLWWGTDAQLQADFTTAGGLLNADGVLVAQWDSFPPQMTSTWGMDAVIYDPKPLQMLDGYTLTDGDYTAIVKVYLWDGEITDIFTLSDVPYVVVARVQLDNP